MIKRPKTRIFHSSLNTLLFIVSIALILFFSKIIYVLYYFPIYPDEIAIRVWLSRAVFDFPNHVNIIPSGDNFLLPMSWVWYLPGLLEWLLHGLLNNLQTLRVVGLILYVAMVALLAFFLLANTKKQSLNHIVIALSLVLSFVSLGVLPAFFVTNRPEQLILICLIILFMMNRYIPRLNNKWITASVILIFFTCVSLMLYVHPKALYLTPLFFFIAYRIFLQLPRRASSYLVFILLGVLIIADFQAWNKELQFLPSVKQFMDSFNINPVSLFTQPTQFFAQLRESILNDGVLLTKVGFQVHTDIDYLPPLTLLPRDNAMNMVIQFNCILLFCLLMGVLIYRYKKDVSRGHYLSSHLPLLLIMGIAVVGNLLNVTKTWYDVGYFWAVIMIVAIVYLADFFALITKNVFGKVMILYFILCAIASLILFDRNYGKPLLHGYAGPGVPLVNFNYEEYKATAALAAKNCLANPSHRGRGLVLDDYTYLYFKQSKNPMLITYVNSHAMVNEFAELVKANKITAIIVRCSYTFIVPNTKAASMMKFNDICCYPENKIHELV